MLANNNAGTATECRGYTCASDSTSLKENMRLTGKLWKSSTIKVCRSTVGTVARPPILPGRSSVPGS
jgi:hypothetical protein